MLGLERFLGRSAQAYILLFGIFLGCSGGSDRSETVLGVGGVVQGSQGGGMSQGGGAGSSIPSAGKGAELGGGPNANGGGVAGTPIPPAGGAAGTPLPGTGGGLAGSPIPGAGGGLAGLPEPQAGGAAGTPIPGAGGIVEGLGGLGVGGMVVPEVGGGSPGGAAGTGGESEECSILGDVAFSTPSQTFRDSIAVGLTTAIAGAQIRYTTDGTVPASASTLYSGSPISLTETTQVRAQAFVGGNPSGALSTAIYIARTIDPTSDLPIIIIDGYGGGKPEDKEVYLDAGVMIFEPVDGVASMASVPTYAVRAGYHVRGQSSSSFPQTPYKVEFWNNTNTDMDCPMLGMPADSDWAFIPPYYDRSLLRNPLTFALGRDMGMQAPRDRFAEVYINYEAHPIGEADYQGIYWVTETIKNNKVRTNLKQLKEDDTTLPDITGGYIMKFDMMVAEEPLLVCTGAEPISTGGFQIPGEEEEPGTCWTDLELVDPEPLNDQQREWITSYIQEFHDVLHMEPMGDYTQYIDVASFVDYLLVSEITMNIDAYTKSAYYYKDRGGKLFAGPLWDYNFALGGVLAMDPLPTEEDPENPFAMGNPTGWKFDQSRDTNNWYPLLVTDANFIAQVKSRYQELRGTLFSDAALMQRIDEMAVPLAQAVVRDYAKWPVEVLMADDLTTMFPGPTEPTWEGQVQVVKDFLTQRLGWMDTSLPQL